MTQKADTKFKREANRGSHDFELACQVLDAGKICHVGFSLDGQPYPCCVTVTHFDGMVYARSTFNSSMNYRSVMIFGNARLVTDPDEKRTGVQTLVDHLMPGRRADLRKSTPKELNATSLLVLPIETFSVKTRTGPPEDSKRDLDAQVWAGVVPLELTAGEPVAAPNLLPVIVRPDYL